MAELVLVPHRHGQMTDCKLCPPARRRRIEVGGCERCGGAVEHRMEVGGPETVCLNCGRRPRPADTLPHVRLHTRV